MSGNCKATLLIGAVFLAFVCSLLYSAFWLDSVSVFFVCYFVGMASISIAALRSFKWLDL